MTDIVWQDPPPQPSARTRWEDVRRTLAARPGDWAMVKPSVSRATVGNIRRALGREFEVTQRKSADGRCDVYARFVGEVSA